MAEIYFARRVNLQLFIALNRKFYAPELDIEPKNKQTRLESVIIF